MWSIGLLLPNIIGTFIPWTQLSLILSIPPSLLLISTPFLPSTKPSELPKSSKSCHHQLDPNCHMVLLVLMFLAVYYSLSGVVGLATYILVLFPGEETVSHSILLIVPVCFQVRQSILFTKNLYDIYIYIYIKP